MVKNSGFARNLLGVLLGIIIAFILVLNPWWGLGSMVASALVYGYTIKARWLRRTNNHSDPELVSQALLQEIEPVQAYYKRGRVRLSQNNYAGAIADLNRVIDIDDNFGKAYYYRAVAFIALEEKSAAIADLQIAADLARQNQEQMLSMEIEQILATWQHGRDLNLARRSAAADGN
jgi:tetratricopeptide (TPR) repeat protein